MIKPGREVRKQEIRNEERLGGRKPVKPVLQLHVVTLHSTLCRSLPVDRAFRLTVSSLLASMSRPVIDLRQPE